MRRFGFSIVMLAATVQARTIAHAQGIAVPPAGDRVETPTLSQCPPADDMCWARRSAFGSKGGTGSGINMRKARTPSTREDTRGRIDVQR